MFRALKAFTTRGKRPRRPEPAGGGAAPPHPRREPTRMELDLYGAIVGKRLREDLNDPDAPPARAARRNVHVPLTPRRSWWRKPPAWVLDHCRALLEGAERVFPMSKRARAAWVELCRRLTRAERRTTREGGTKRPRQT